MVLHADKKKKKNLKKSSRTRFIALGPAGPVTIIYRLLFRLVSFFFFRFSATSPDGFFFRRPPLSQRPTRYNNRRPLARRHRVSQKKVREPTGRRRFQCRTRVTGARCFFRRYTSWFSSRSSHETRTSVKTSLTSRLFVIVCTGTGDSRRAPHNGVK